MASRKKESGSKSPAGTPQSLILKSGSSATIPIHIVAAGTRPADLTQLSEPQRAWLNATGYNAAAGTHATVPDVEGKLGAVVYAAGSDGDSERLGLGGLARSLPAGDYRIEGKAADANLDTLAWLLGAYSFDRYRRNSKEAARLLPSAGVDVGRAQTIAKAVWLGRDLINTPANDLGPQELEDAARALATEHKADVESTIGDDLLARNFPMIHAVGRASPRAPRLVELNWGKKNAPAIVLVGKGICFDTGGLNIKPGASMALMKKDMGGAAAAIALADMIMSAKLDVRLRVLLAIAENNIDGNAFRPGDVLQSRKGLTVEIGNTDAEGRLVLGDALALADEIETEAIFSFATLTGAARVALGPDLPAMFSTQAEVAANIEEAGLAVDDPVWRLPFWSRYDKLLASSIADVNHISNGPFAGAITAALFLKRFVGQAKSYTHFDLFGWVPDKRPGRPKGGEPQTARAVFEYLSRTYG